MGTSSHHLTPFFPPPRYAGRPEEAQDGQGGPSFLQVLPCLFPQVPPVIPAGFSGNPVSCFLSLIRVAPAWENHGFPITNVGNDRGGD